MIPGCKMDGFEVCDIALLQYRSWFVARCQVSNSIAIICTMSTSSKQITEEASPNRNQDH
jgi:hypothetical protein